MTVSEQWGSLRVGDTWPGTQRGSLWMAGRKLQEDGQGGGCDSSWDLLPPREQEVAQMSHPFGLISGAL